MIVTPAATACRNRGFTLVEALATIAVLSIVGLASSRLILESSSRFTDAVTRSQLHATGTSAMSRIVSELGGVSPLSGVSPTAPNINSASSSTSVTFVGSGGATRTITYNSGASTIIITGSAAASQTLASDCTAFSFTYLDSTGGTISPASGTSLIRRVVVQFTLSRAGVSETIRTSVYIRSMMSGSGAS